MRIRVIETSQDFSKRQWEIKTRRSTKIWLFSWKINRWNVAYNEIGNSVQSTWCLVSRNFNLTFLFLYVKFLEDVSDVWRRKGKLKRQKERIRPVDSLLDLQCGCVHDGLIDRKSCLLVIPIGDDVGRGLIQLHHDQNPGTHL